MTSNEPGETGHTGADVGSEAAAFVEKQKPIEATQQAETAPTEEKKDPVSEEKQEPAPSEKNAEEPSTSTAPVEKKEEQEPVTSEKKISEEEATAAVAAAPTPASTGPTAPAPTSTSSSEPTWPDTPADHPLTKFFDSITDLTSEADHNEVYGITLSKTTPFHTKLILQKFLRANSNDLTKAKEQLLETLKWRKAFDPVKAVGESYDKERFEGLGYILMLDDVPESGNQKDVVTFNIYGAVKDNKKTFGDLDGFLRWRVGLMERSVQKLNLANATQPIPDFGQGPDPYQGFQVHDYLQVSFIRMDPNAKAASKKTIETFGRYYPETLSRKFFVNVPVLMGWLFAAMKLFVAKETVKKFTVLSYGNQLAAELGQGIPKEYGGSGAELKEIGEGMKVKE